MKELKTLIVEDDPVGRSLLEKKLKKAGYNVEVADNGDEAAKLVSRFYFDVVITDLMLPGGMDGVAVMEYTKAKHRNTEVILITAYATVDNAVEAMKKGAFDYLEKPVNLNELMLCLEKIGTMKSLARDATDLREAMNVTEKNAAKTIQDLEIMVSRLQHQLAAIKETLSDRDVQDNERIARALEILS